jgi:hypothetical protein
LTNYEINIDKKDSNLLPNFCTSDDSSSSDSSDESTETSSDETKSSNLNRNETMFKVEKIVNKKFNKPKKFSKQEKKSQSKWIIYWNRYRRFVHSPRVHFFYDVMFYIIFLALFSYMILCEFNYLDISKEVFKKRSIVPINNNSLLIFSSNSSIIINEKDSNNSANDVYETTQIRTKSTITVPSWIEYLLIYWIFAFVTEEARQVSQLDF